MAVIGELDLLWLRRFGERETWGTDSHDAITAEIAAALGITRGLADSYLDYARAMRVRLPRVGALLVAGDIDYRTFQTIVYRTDLITDADLLAAVDAQLALKVPRWTGITQGRLGAYVDRVVARADRDAVRRRRERRGQREVAFFGDADGVSEMFGPAAHHRRPRRRRPPGRVGRHRVRRRPAHPPAAPRRRPGCAGRRGRPAGVPLRAPGLPALSRRPRRARW